MIVTVKLSEGSVQSFDVATIIATLGSSPIHLSFESEPARLRVFTPGDDKQWHSLMIRPGAGEYCDHRR